MVGELTICAHLHVSPVDSMPTERARTSFVRSEPAHHRQRHSGIDTQRQLPGADPPRPAASSSVDQRGNWRSRASELPCGCGRRKARAQRRFGGGATARVLSDTVGHHPAARHAQADLS